MAWSRGIFVIAASPRAQTGVLAQDTRQFIIPWSAEKHAAAIADPDCIHLIVCKAQDQERLGFVMLFGAASPHRSIECTSALAGRQKRKCAGPAPVRFRRLPGGRHAATMHTRGKRKA